MSTVQTCTQDGMVPSQPGMCVSYTGGADGYTLSVFRAYNDLPNQWGGKGVHRHCDHYGKKFATYDEAAAFALDRGYVRPWFKSAESRAHRKAEARDPRKARKPKWSEFAAA